MALLVVVGFVIERQQHRRARSRPAEEGGVRPPESTCRRSRSRSSGCMSAACGRSFEACSRAGDPQVAFGRPSRRRSRTSPGDGGTWHCVDRAPCTASPAGERERRRLPAAVPDHRATDRLRGNGTTTGLTRLLVGATGSGFRSRLRGFADSAVRRQGSSRGSGLVASPRKPARRPAFARDRWSRHSDLNRGPAVYETAALPLSYVGADGHPTMRR